MHVYKTSEIAKIYDVHPNTVRLYEKWKLIPEAKRQNNGYRVFTDFHVEQFKLARTALQMEVLQNGLRKTSITIIKLSAAGDFDHAITLSEDYLRQITTEQQKAQEAIQIVTNILSGAEEREEKSQLFLTRNETAKHLQVTIDTLRNWELNGLLTVKRRQNGYRVYTQEDLKRLKIIRSLRCANYSLSSILRMLGALSQDPSVNIQAVIDTPKDDEDIVSVCDKLVTSLKIAKVNVESIIIQLWKMKKCYSQK